ncbi:MAG: hypothetical protein NZM35_03970 [Chitinophagales bacterium]|nr:hypothetical protein [Chitinophagales bacterium]MDW8418753.1 hypothetical protein [Chitinophagales bacterium]
MLRWTTLLICFAAGQSLLAAPTDSLRERMRAAETLRMLKNGGCIIFRLKTNEKSIRAYQDAGRQDIAERIREERKKQNTKIAHAFRQYFTFCKVYFIYASETQHFLSGKPFVLLNEYLQPDTSQQACRSAFIFGEYGSVSAVPRTGNTTPDGMYYAKPDRILDTVATTYTSSPVTVEGIFFSDSNLNPLQRPFPFVVGVYLDNYNAAVKALNREFFNAYQRLIINEEIRQMKRQQKNQRRKS